jgi:hypothetical protein
MIKFTKKSLELIDVALEVSDIYSIDDFNYNIAAHDVGTVHDNRIDELRTKWMFSKTGLYNGIVDNKYAMARIFEFLFNGDFNKSLRQRLNIVQEMFKVNFKSNVPVHISLGPKFFDKRYEEFILDFDNPSTFDNFNVIIHPGQTRAQASVFCKRNLDNVLLYIPKVYKNLIKIKNFPKHIKITGEKELTKCYSTFVDKQEDRIIDLKFRGHGDDIEKNLKYHKQRVVGYPHRYHSIYILKACAIKVQDKEEHPSHYYLEQSFTSFNKFCQIFHRNEYTLYTTLHGPQAKTLFFENTNRLFSLTSNKIKYHPKRIFNILESTDSAEPATGIYFTSKMINSFDDEKIKPFIKNLQEVYDKHRGPLEYEMRKGILNSPPSIHYPVESVNGKFDYKDIAHKQDYKGFAVWYNPTGKPKLYRDIYELLFFTCESISCTISENKELAIINCEHEYWKTGNNYKEWILTENMYND